jgi:hypothetical protein
MLIRMVTVLLCACLVATGQQPYCSSLTLNVEIAPYFATAPAWMLFVENNRSQPAVVRISAHNFHWKIEQAEKGAWSEVLTGGIGLGEPSTASIPPQNLDTRTITKQHRSFVGDFDLRRDIPAESLKLLTEYRITFEQDIDLIDSAGRVNECRLVAKPQVFRFEDK